MENRSKIKIVWQTRTRNQDLYKNKSKYSAFVVLLVSLAVAGFNLLAFRNGGTYADNSYAARVLDANPNFNPKLATKLNQTGVAINGEQPGEKADGKNKVGNVFINTARAQTVDLQDQEEGEHKPFEYEVEDGDTLSSIAQKYNIKLETILWANSLTAKSIIRPGQKITLLPVDGVLYTVKKGDTVGKIAALHESGSQKIITYNDIADPTKIHAGDAIIIPDGRPLPQVSPIKPPKTGGNMAQGNDVPAPSAETPAIGKLLWPTTTKNLSQKYSAKHRGLDIANGGQPPVYASQNGTVEFAGKSGDWGNTILIRGDNGLVTRYSHNAENYVTAGDRVEAGATIAKVGNTGNVRGKTGLHVDFRVYKNGVAVNPMNYY